MLAPVSPQLDSIDQAVVSMLRTDGRATAATVAGQLGLSHSAARGRLNRLLETNVVRVVGVTNTALTGRPLLYFAECRFERPDHPTIQQLAGLPYAHWITLLGDRTRVVLECSAVDPLQVADVVNSLRAMPGVSSAGAEMILRIHPTGPHAVPARQRRVTPTSIRFDDRANQIIVDELGRHGRATYTALAALSGLSVPATRERVLRLLDEGIVDIHTIVDPAAEGLHSTSAAALDVSGDTAAAIRAIAAIPEVRYIVEVASATTPLRIEIVCRDEARRAEVLAQLAAIPRVRIVAAETYATVLREDGGWR